VAASLFLLPLVCDPSGYDAFRYPKFLLFRLTAILIAAILITAALFGKLDVRRLIRKRSRIVMLAAVVLWSVITTMLSTNRLVSYRTFECTAEALLFFVAAWIAVRDSTLNQVIAAPFAAGVINAIVAVVQRTNVWSVFPFAKNLPVHLRTTALMGNPNDVGSYLLPITIAAIAIAFLRRRWYWTLIACTLTLGIAVSEALTAIAGCVAAALVLSVILSRRNGMRVVAATLVCVLIAIAAVPPVRNRIERLEQAIRQHDLAEATSQRIYPFMTAWKMFRDHPVTGVGPGVFKYRFLEYRLGQIQTDYRFFALNAENFGEVHSDHLQVLAEEGLPGWLLLMAFFVLIGWTTAETWAAADERRLFVRYAGAPIAAGLFTLAIAAFPMELTAVLQVILYFSAVLLSWSETE